MKVRPFWKITPKGAITIDEGLLVNFLSQIGYASYYHTSEMTIEPIYLHKKKWLIEPIIPTRIHTETIKAIEDGIIDEDILPAEARKDLISKLISSKSLTKKEVLAVLPELDKPLITDTETEAKFFYKNGIVNVTGDGISLTNSDITDGYVWKSQLIDRPFELCSSEEIKNSEYYRFLRNISGSNKEGQFTINNERFKSLLSLHGYLLHTYKDFSNPRSVIFMDASISDQASGRTGKGIIVQGLNKLRKVCTQNGKNINTDNRFQFSNVDSDVKILSLDDVPKDFEFESFFSLITEGITIEAKYANKYFIPFEKSPKIVISTNYSVVGSGSSHEARKYEYELSNYYSDTRTPKDEFGHQLFTDWDSTEWMYFDNLMMNGVRYYLKNGVCIPESSDREYKKFVTATSSDFAEWIESKKIEVNKRYDKNDLYVEYSIFCEGQPEISDRQLNGYLKNYARFKGLQCVIDHSGPVRYVLFIQ